MLKDVLQTHLGSMPQTKSSTYKLCVCCAGGAVVVLIHEPKKFTTPSKCLVLVCYPITVGKTVAMGQASKNVPSLHTPEMEKEER